MIKRMAASLFLSGGLLSCAQAGEFCRTNEEVAFNCKHNQKIAELCYSKDTNSFIYRFRSGNKVYLAYPEIASGSGGEFFVSSRPYPGGGEGHVKFTKNGYTYYIYDRNLTTRESFETGAGVVAEKDGKSVENFRCSNDASIHATAYEHLREETYKGIDQE
ncbi:hypothetical protein NDK50_09545 [Paraburkholderia bryophila]|uniref:hypothetical protein n=1 Tax=Paraburkholderia bryophila TaxID=420952 RepID=UPI00234B331F|nr:hypothetical protein [Paraburkholderia bryophila]WCM21668.1 hypothetical protein NDK50_09545 [Paraburkholderia bryophila]